ncbi:DUF4145 domain-containing protein [Pectobacterium versatile]|uniref:DUF4145 domain-containing protein n=1 Tax=Enterobacterales TaxID=91347 RepID=UPI001064779C|nr:DUF4145 domain-containing protein [Buttiauxella sp. BIGb0552]TDX20275.1 uncharacterized protein DUF4145 [Buttiauxella sp. BIGb0552]
MNPSLLTHFTENHCPNWACPSCHSTSLAIQEGTFHYAALPESVARWKEPEGEYEDIYLVFSCLLKCERARCEMVVAVSGSGGVHQNYGEDGDEPHYELFQARHFIPPLPAFAVPPHCPENVAQPLMQSFGLFLSAPNAAANAIRIALEELMTALGVPVMRSLHSRIEALPEQFSEHKAALMAIKWLGNAGSHALDRVNAFDIDQAYRIIEFVLSKLYAGSTKSIKQLAADLDKRFRPEQGN